MILGNRLPYEFISYILREGGSVMVVIAYYYHMLILLLGYQTEREGGV